MLAHMINARSTQVLAHVLVKSNEMIEGMVC